MIYNVTSTKRKHLDILPIKSTLQSMIAALWIVSSIAHSQANEQNFLVGIALDKTISIQADNANLKDVLLEIETITGIPVNFVSDTTQRVSLNIADQSIEDAIRKLTPNSMIMRSLQDGIEVINEIIIISDDPDTASSSDGSSFLPSGQPAPVIAEENDAQLTTAPSDDPAQNQPAIELQNNEDAPTATN